MQSLRGAALYIAKRYIFTRGLCLLSCSNMLFKNRYTYMIPFLYQENCVGTEPDLEKKNFAWQTNDENVFLVEKKGAKKKGVFTGSLSCPYKK